MQREASTGEQTTSKEVTMPKPTMEDLQRALDSLVAKGVIEIIGSRKGQPVYRSTAYREDKGTKVLLKAHETLQ